MRASVRILLKKLAIFRYFRRFGVIGSGGAMRFFGKIVSGLLILTAAVFLWFGGKSTFGIFQYFLLDRKTEAIVERWDLEEKQEDAFAIIASYRFFLGEKEFGGVTEFFPPHFPNRISAEKAIQKLSLEKWEVFYSSKNPEKNSLQRKFPFVLCFDAVLLAGLFIYFLLLQKKIRKLSVSGSLDSYEPS